MSYGYDCVFEICTILYTFVDFQVIWEVIGPYPGQEMNDISPTGGVLILQNGQR